MLRFVKSVFLSVSTGGSRGSKDKAFADSDRFYFLSCDMKGSIIQSL